MVALSEEEQEYWKQKHEKANFLCDSQDHCHQEVKLTEHSDEVNYFDQAEAHT